MSTGEPPTCPHCGARYNANCSIGMVHAPGCPFTTASSSASQPLYPANTTNPYAWAEFAPHYCPHCGAVMHKLTTQIEGIITSLTVDYICPECGRVERVP